MFRTDRHLNKKRNGQHNFFGEDDYINTKGSVVIDEDIDSPPDNDILEVNEDSG